MNGWVFVPHMLRCGEVVGMDSGYLYIELYGDRNSVWLHETEIEWITREA